MHRDSLDDILGKISDIDLPKTILVLRGGSGITLDAIASKEGDYIVVRGREAGTNDEGRGFFVPYEDVLFVKIDRMMKVDELRAMYGLKGISVASALDDVKPAEADRKPEAAASAAPSPSSPMDPASIAKQNLLARIRAARTSANSA